jgi:hypothetical protein
MSAGTYRFKIIGKAPKYRHEGARSGAKSKRTFKTKQIVRNHVTALCKEMNLNAKES